MSIVNCPEKLVSKQQRRLFTRVFNPSFVPFGSIRRIVLLRTNVIIHSHASQRLVTWGRRRWV